MATSADTATTTPTVPSNLLNPGINLNEVAGGVLVGVLINCVIYGVVFTQSVRYFIRFRAVDHWILLTLVSALLLLNTMSLFNGSAIAYLTFVKHFGEYDFLLSQGKPYQVYGCSNIVVTLFVQNFLCWRTLRVSQNHILCALISAVSLLSMAGGIACVWITSQQGALANRDMVTTMDTIWMVGAAVCDFLIVASLMWYLSRIKSTFNRTNSLLRKVMFYIIPSGVIPSMFALAAFIGFKVKPNSQIPFALNFSVGLWYSYTLMFNLLMRQSLNPEFNSYSNTDQKSPGLQREAPGAAAINLRDISITKIMQEDIETHESQKTVPYRFDDHEGSPSS